jgi:hypothetical protein
MLANSGISGYGIAFDIGSWYEFFPKELPDWGYYACFLSCVQYFTTTQKHHDGTPMTFTFDHRMESEHNAGVLFDVVVNLPEWKDDNIFWDATINFGSPKNDVRLQAADLLARETMKALDNVIGPKPRPPRKSVLALKAAGERFKFELLDNRFCKRVHKQINNDRAFLGGGEVYDQWLAENKQSDCWSSRFRFMSWAAAKGWLGSTAPPSNESADERWCREWKELWSDE